MWITIGKLLSVKSGAHNFNHNSNFSWPYFWYLGEKIFQSGSDYIRGTVSWFERFTIIRVIYNELSTRINHQHSRSCIEKKRTPQELFQGLVAGLYFITLLQFWAYDLWKKNLGEVSLKMTCLKGHVWIIWEPYQESGNKDITWSN